jgi:hypothetical protein
MKIPGCFIRVIVARNGRTGKYVYETRWMPEREV